MMACRILPLGLCLALASCAVPVGSEAEHGELQGRKAPARTVDSAFTLDQMSAFVQQTSSQDINTQRAAAKQLQSKHEISAGDQLKLAYLLSLENASGEDLAQSQAILDGLEAQFGDPPTRLYVRLLQRTVSVESALKIQRKRADELQEKLRQLKKLELELMQRNQSTPAQGK